ncbi:transposase [Lysinibacillus sp. HST-98]|uniref:transposase n=1 Tax=Lysinibacillus TaxID=400634 RepID=UPI0019266CD5|nr:MULTISPECIES: transposase [Lysinibacillus]MBL3729659.1 transposase [Lysinibacillus sp. HST-98]MEC1305462.1 transposase [Lysinibacillus capsici]WPK07441.1 transposase [Lysinibacillus capsici]
MTKYSEEFKLMVVQEYLSGSIGYRAIAKKYSIGDSPLRRWVRAYKEFGRNGLLVKKTKQFYSVHFKIDVLNFMKPISCIIKTLTLRGHYLPYYGKAPVS